MVLKLTTSTNTLRKAPTVFTESPRIIGVMWPRPLGDEGASGGDRGRALVGLRAALILLHHIVLGGR
jgi:hypothetical protein